MKKLKKSSSLFIKLIYGYILFGIILFISIGMAIIYMSFDYEQKVRDGVFINIDSSEILKDEYTLKDDLNSVKKSYYSWMELLDNEGNVVDVKGNKRDSTIHYDNDELSKAVHRGDNPYYADILVFDDNNGNKRYCLIKYERDVLEFEGKFTSSRKYFVIKNEQGVKINSILYKGGVIFILLCIMDAAFLSLWINKKVKVPLKHIENGFLEIGTGNLDVQLNFRAEKEFEIIEEKFNSMVKMLKNSIDEKEKSEESKKLMLLNLSHDIKTPLATIRGYVTALDNGYVSEEEKIKQYYHTLVLKTERISDLIDELFYLLKIGNEKYKITFTKTDIFEFLRETVAEYYNDIEEKGLELEINIPDTKCIKNISHKLMKRAIGNLLSNALKYSETGKKLIISAREKDGSVCIVIQDEGKGIPKEIKETLFEPFVLGDAARQTCGGNGLGLAIVKTIVERHNGKVTYVDTEVGARFEIFI